MAPRLKVCYINQKLCTQSQLFKPGKMDGFYSSNYINVDPAYS